MVCLITGSSRGLGRAVALAFGKRGHRVAVHCRERLKDAEDVASCMTEAVAIRGDVRDPVEVKQVIDAVIGKWGRIDVLVNNAGITREALLLRTSEDDFDDVLRTNLKGPFHFIRNAARHMMKQGSGHIINISSYAGMKGKEGLSAYSASKGGLTGLTKSAAVELSRYNIMVNSVLPGYMLTDMGTGSTEKGKGKALRESIVKEYSDPHTAAEFICWLSETRGITGQVFNLDSRIV